MFAKLDLAPVAEDAVATILRALWAFWSDLNGILAHAYPQFCVRLKELMPSQPPDGGDVTLAMKDFILWVKDTFRTVSALKFRTPDSELNKHPLVPAAVPAHRRRRNTRRCSTTVRLPPGVLCRGSGTRRRRECPPGLQGLGAHAAYGCRSGKSSGVQRLGAQNLRHIAPLL